MPHATLARPGRTTALARLAGALRRERTIVRTALAIVAAHVVDDTLVQPPAGTPATDHLVSAVVPVGLLALAAWGYPRLSGFARGALALALGLTALAVGVEGAYYALAAGPSGDDFTGLLTLLAGIALLGVGAATLWRTRRTEGTPVWRYPRRLLLAVAAFFAFQLVVLPLGLAYVTTHTARAVVPANELGVAYENVSFRTSDGLRLEGWYVPSRNGAAVISFPGRNGPQRQARMLARHGYGVLLFDRRGEGRSEGAPNAWGWGGERDIEAAVAFLRHRHDVDAARIGGIGLSVGGEMMIEAAAETDALAAVVSEGAGARAFADEMDHDVGAVDQWLGIPTYGVRTLGGGVSATQPPPHRLEALVGRSAPRPLMLTAAPNSGKGGALNRRFIRAAGAPSTLWEIP